MLTFPDPSVSTEYTDPNGSVWEFNGTGWVRQGDSSGGGDGGGGDGMWPSFPKPSVDLLATRQNAGGNGQGRGLRLLQVADDGTLSDYDFVSLASAPMKAEFCPTDTLFAVIIWDTVSIYDYSKVPCQEVGKFKLPWGIADWGWSQGGKYIFCAESNGRNVEVWENVGGTWEKYAPNSRILDDLSADYFEEMGIDDPEQMLFAHSCVQLCGVNGGPHNEEAFIVTINYQPSDTDYQDRSKNTLNLVKATPSGCVVVGGDSGLLIDPAYTSYSVPQPNYTSRAICHPQSGSFVYHGRGTNRPSGLAHMGVGRAALFADGTGSCSVGSELSERWVGSEDGVPRPDSSPGTLVANVAMSPSGNFLIARRQGIWGFDTFRMHRSGVLERLGVAPNHRSNNEVFHQWSADEKYLYRWHKYQIDRYEWNDGNPVLVDTQISDMESPYYSNVTPPNISLVGNQSHLNRSKF